MSLRRSRSLSVLLVAGAVALAGCGGDDPVDALREAEPGDCLVAPRELDDDYELVDCGPDADYEVLEVLDVRLPDDPEASPCQDQAYDYGLSLTQGDPFSLCLQQLPEEGDCVYQGRYIPCEDGGGSRVTAVLTGTTDVADCTERASGRVYQDDEVVVCLAPNGV